MCTCDFVVVFFEVCCLMSICLYIVINVCEFVYIYVIVRFARESIRKRIRERIRGSS